MEISLKHNPLVAMVRLYNVVESVKRLDKITNVCHVCITIKTIWSKLFAKLCERYATELVVSLKRKVQ